MLGKDLEELLIENQEACGSMQDKGIKQCKDCPRFLDDCDGSGADEID